MRAFSSDLLFAPGGAALNNIFFAVEQISGVACNEISCSSRKGSCFKRFISKFEVEVAVQVLVDGELLAVRKPLNGHVAFTVVGERGNPNKIGGCTIRLAAELRCKSHADSETYIGVKSLQLDETHFVAFPQTDLGKYLSTFTQADIDRLGRNTFQNLGDEARFIAWSHLGKERAHQAKG